MIKEIINNYFINNLPESILYLYLAFAFTLLITNFNYKRFLKKYNDYQAYILYFISFFVVLFIIPLVLIYFFSDDFSLYLKQIGFTFGKTEIGIPILLIGIPLFYLISVFSINDPQIQNFYPFSKEACKNNKKFLFFELCYLLFYYFTWEFIFRGLLFFPLIPKTGLVIAIIIQTMISTIYHIGHPDKEISGALGGGFLFGIIAFVTGSFFYSIVLHAFLGITNDTLLCKKIHTKKQSADSRDSK